MTTQQDIQRAGLRVLMADEIRVPDYSADPVVVCRVGKVLTETSARVRVFPIEEHWR